MVRKTKKRKQDIIKNCSIIAAILLIVVASSFVAYKYLFKPNNYIIQNNYYGFKLQTPKGWIAEENILFSPDYITKTLAKCKKDKSKTSHEYACAGRLVS